MLTLAWPWVLAALALPLVLRWLLPPARRVQGRALRLPANAALAALAALPEVRLRRLRLLVAVAAWLLLVLAAARPQWLGEPAALPMSGRDLMLVVDVSGSMEQPDFELAGQPASRLAVVKQAARAFIERRAQDRLGLILFASAPYVQTPLTYDRNAVVQMLEEAVVGLAGRDTAIGDAIGLAVKRLRAEPPGNRVIVLLTDGDNSVGRLTPLQAAGLAARAGVRIYSIGLGGVEGASVGGYRLRQAGDDLNPELLRAVASLTGGRYFAAADARELAAAYAALDRLEPSVRALQTYRPARDLYPLPAALALGLCLLLALPHLHLHLPPPVRARLGGHPEAADAGVAAVESRDAR
ncbi:VWA domain-containing protein [Thiohalocapsa sp. ML1]|uniref:VWA domain-containing protein n=1 Tax=Thiohalocapsa sp. ML1 TaxID=1431688 RepID=UPI00073200F7|nr:VWA domain-containing protein [Thiohalocapsa sp. ML1]